MTIFLVCSLMVNTLMAYFFVRLYKQFKFVQTKSYDLENHLKIMARTEPVDRFIDSLVFRAGKEGSNKIICEKDQKKITYSFMFGEDKEEILTQPISTWNTLTAALDLFPKNKDQCHKAIILNQHVNIEKNDSKVLITLV